MSKVSLRNCTRALGLAALLPWLVAPSARAGGVEASVAGARSVGRGGATAASAEGFDALRYDPARLAIGSGTTFQADAQMLIAPTCFDRVDANGTTYPRVCNAAPPSLVPQVGLRASIGSRVGIGFGILPPAGIAQLRFGDPNDGTIRENGQRTPSPARYALVSSNNLAFFPTVGVGVAAHEKVRLGLSFGWGVFMVQNVVFAAGVPGAGPELDVRTGLAGVDTFVPKLTFALDFEPVRGFNISSVTSWTSDVHARASMFVSGVNGGQGFSHRVDGVSVTQPLGFEQTVALRYSAPRFDLEIDGVLQANGRTRDVLVDIPDDATLPIDGTIDGQPLSAMPDEIRVARHWRHQWQVRVGGDAVVIPDRWNLRAGFSFESNGVQHGYESVDNLPLRGFGVHVGTSVHVSRVVELTLGYARILRPTTYVDPADARIEQSVGARPGSLADDHVYVNAGTYRSTLHVVGAAIVIHPNRPHSVSR